MRWFSRWARSGEITKDEMLDILSRTIRRESECFARLKEILTECLSVSVEFGEEKWPVAFYAYHDKSKSEIYLYINAPNISHVYGRFGESLFSNERQAHVSCGSGRMWTQNYICTSFKNDDLRSIVCAFDHLQREMKQWDLIVPRVGLPVIPDHVIVAATSPTDTKQAKP